MNELKRLANPQGLPVAELKKHIADWPEIDANGEPTGVWLETGRGLSSQCVGVEILNYRELGATRKGGAEWKIARQTG